jgi:hypothetical protein
MKVVAGGLGAADRVVVLPGAGRGVERHRLEAWEAQAEAVLRGHGVDADAEKPVGRHLEERQHSWIEAPHLRQEVRVARAGEARPLLGGGEPGERIEGLGEEPPEVALHGVGERGCGQQPLVEPVEVARHDHVLPERLAIEEEAGAQAERRVQRAVQQARIAADVDSELLDQALGDGAVRRRAVDRLCAAIADPRASAVGELVALGVPAEVVVVIEHEDARVGTCLAEVVRGGQPADAAADDNEVVVLASGCRRPHRAP